MLRLLLRLWWLNFRRSSSKREIIGMTVLVGGYVCVLIGIFVGAKASGNPIKGIEAPPYVGMVLVIVMAMCDILMKMTMKREVTVMDDYIKARPIPERLWAVFLMITNTLSWDTIAMPLIFLMLTFLFLSVGQIFACFCIMLFFSVANSLFVTCFRRTTDRFLRFSLIAGWLVMLMEMSLCALFLSFAPAWMQYFGMSLLAIAVMGGLYAFLANEENYDERRHKATRQWSIGRVTLFTMQFFGVLRAKRIRNMVIIAGVIFIGDVYLMAFTTPPENNQMVLYAVLAVIFPSLTLSQWTFGIEANFFPGLMSKPVTVRRLLSNCYCFYLIISFISFLLIIPIVFVTDQLSLFMLFASLCVAAVINLFNMPTCLFSNRIDMFSRSFFNYQGASMKLNLYSLALIIPIGILAGIWLLWGPTVWAVVSIALGLISLAVHRPVINYIATLFMKKKYDRLEAFAV